MISLTLARQLKEAGLVWQTQINDFFAIPDRGMDERVFVLSEMQANMDIFRGWPVVTFHGAAEWALDYMLTSEVVWLPTEEQLRDSLQNALAKETRLSLQLALVDDVYHCTIFYRGESHYFADPSAGDAYGKALLHVL